MAGVFSDASCALQLLRHLQEHFPLFGIFYCGSCTPNLQENRKYFAIIQCIAKTGHSYILLDESVENKKEIFPIQWH